MSRRIARLGGVVGIAVILGAAAALGADDVSAQDGAGEIQACPTEQFGPGGETPTPLEELVLTEDEIAAVKALGKELKVATFWHFASNTTELMTAGMTDTWLKYELPITISYSASANFDAATQVDQIETLLATSPDAMVGIPTDQTAITPAVQKVNDAGVPIVFWDLPATGADFSAISTSNARLAGCRAADALAQAIGGTGKVAVLPLQFAFFPTDERVTGFKERVASTYPDIEVIEQGATTFEDGQVVTEALLQAYPDLVGVFASWQDPAMGAVAAARSLNRPQLAVTAVDLGDAPALNIATCGNLKATAAQLPYDEGVAEAILVAKILAGTPDIPKYVVSDAPLADHETILDVYKQVFHREPPSELTSAYVPTC